MIPAFYVLVSASESCGGRTAFEGAALEGTAGGTTSAPSSVAGSGWSENAGGTDATAAGTRTSVPAGMCPLFEPPTRTYYPGDVGASCPTQSHYNETCNNTLIGVACVLPSTQNPDSEDVCDCYGPQPGDAPFMPYWNCTSKYCHRTGNTCLEDAEIVGSEIQLTSPCESRTPIVCNAYTAEETAQTALDNSLSDVLVGCGLGNCGRSGVLTVYFDLGCATKFVLGSPDSSNSTQDPQLIACVAQQLEAVSFSCASGIECGEGNILATLICIL